MDDFQTILMGFENLPREQRVLALAELLATGSEPINFFALGQLSEIGEELRKDSHKLLLESYFGDGCRSGIEAGNALYRTVAGVLYEVATDGKRSERVREMAYLLLEENIGKRVITEHVGVKGCHAPSSPWG